MASYTSSAPVPLATADHFHQVMAAFAPFEKKPVVALALSGGIDSMALTLLAYDWLQRYQGRLIALTVDHGLRDTSASEALAVQRLCHALGIQQHILSWQPPDLQSGVQAHARAARYRLLTDWCRQRHILHLLTAHHQDDQAETLFFRLARGSGLDGLACIPAESFTGGVRLLRPLLGFTKKELEAFLNAKGQAWVEDPSNQAGDYTRNTIRAHLQRSDQDHTLRTQAASLAARLGNIRNHMENRLASYLAESAALFPEGYAWLDHRRFSDMPPEYGLRCLSCLLQTLGGAPYRPRTEKLHRLHGNMLALSRNRTLSKYTLSGLQLVFYPEKAKWLVAREPNAVQPALPAPPRQRLLWDGRFACHHDADLPLSVGAVGSRGLSIIKRLGHTHELLAEKPVLSSLPAFWHLEELIAVPHMEYRHPDYQKAGCFVRFIPAKPLAATAFSGMNMRSD